MIPHPQIRYQNGKQIRSGMSPQDARLLVHGDVLQSIIPPYQEVTVVSDGPYGAKWLWVCDHQGWIYKMPNHGVALHRILHKTKQETLF